MEGATAGLCHMMNFFINHDFLYLSLLEVFITSSTFHVFYIVYFDDCSETMMYYSKKKFLIHISYQSIEIFCFQLVKKEFPSNGPQNIVLFFHVLQVKCQPTKKEFEFALADEVQYYFMKLLC